MRVSFRSETSNADLPLAQESSTSSYQAESPSAAGLRYRFGTAAALIFTFGPTTTLAVAQFPVPERDSATYLYVQRRRRITRGELLARADAILQRAEAYRLALLEAESRLNASMDDDDG
jgi:hypothetical protein